MTIEVRTLVGTVVGITGATSGIGRATARAAVDAGAKVVLNGRRADRLEDLVAELGPENVFAVQGDVALPETSRLMASAAFDRFGRLDSIVLAAGSGMYGGVLDHSDDELARMIEANLNGTVWAVRSAVPVMVQSGGGDIVIVSSVAGIRGGGHEAVYAATKAAQLNFAGAIDRELRELGIRVTAICPAAVNTEFAIGFGRESADPWLNDVLDAEDVAAAILVTLQQPRRLRTTQWTMWSAVEGS